MFSSGAHYTICDTSCVLPGSRQLDLQSWLHVFYGGKNSSKLYKKGWVSWGCHAPSDAILTRRYYIIWSVQTQICIRFSCLWFFTSFCCCISILTFVPFDKVPASAVNSRYMYKDWAERQLLSHFSLYANVDASVTIPLVFHLWKHLCFCIFIQEGGNIKLLLYIFNIYHRNLV